MMPTKVESGENTNLIKQGSGGSAWNSAGTWEEKHLKKNEVEDFFNKSLTLLDFNNLFKVTKVFKFSGDAYIVFCRNKQKIIYDCEMSMIVEGKGGFETASGELEITDISNEDFEFKYKSFSGEQSDKFKSIVSSLKTEIEKAIKNTFNMMIN